MALVGRAATMSNTKISKTNTFSPLYDRVLEDTSLLTAAIFGRVWRYCQMEDGVCSATQAKIAKGLGVHRTVVNRHLQILVTKGYLRDLTPDLHNHPHKYEDTGKANGDTPDGGVLPNTPEPDVLPNTPTTEDRAGVLPNTPWCAGNDNGCRSEQHEDRIAFEDRKEPLQSAERALHNQSDEHEHEEQVGSTSALITQGPAADISPSCPKCGFPMRLDVRESGPKAGTHVWLCLRWPACYGSIEVGDQPVNEEGNTN